MRSTVKALFRLCFVGVVAAFVASAMFGVSMKAALFFMALPVILLPFGVFAALAHAAGIDSDYLKSQEGPATRAAIFAAGVRAGYKF